MSAIFSYPFTSERRVQERLQRLCAAGRVRRWLYATAGQGALSYYTLSPLGYRLLHGLDAPPAARGLIGPVGVARQAHTQALAEVIVRLFVSARAVQSPIVRFSRENSLRLDLGDQILYPDGAFELQPNPRSQFRFFLEIDNRTETVSVGSSPDSWGCKVQFYEKLQDSQDERFRVLVVTTGGRQRLDHMLETAKTLAHNSRRSLVYAVSLSEFLDAENAITSLCFRNTHGHFVALLSAVPPDRRAVGLTVRSALVASPACLRPLPAV